MRLLQEIGLATESEELRGGIIEPVKDDNIFEELKKNPHLIREGCRFVLCMQIRKKSPGYLYTRCLYLHDGVWYEGHQGVIHSVGVYKFTCWAEIYDTSPPSTTLGDVFVHHANPRICED
jgi:hypothetical protein